MRAIVHRAPMSGFGPLPCCGRLPSQTTDTDIVTGQGVVTCDGPIPLPPPETHGNIWVLVREAQEYAARGRATGDTGELLAEADRHRGYWGDRTALLPRPSRG